MIPTGPPSRPFCGYEGLSLEELLERSRNEFRLQDAESGAVAAIKPTLSVLPDLVPQQPGAETGVKSVVRIRSANSGDAGMLPDLGWETFHETLAAQNKPDDMDASTKESYEIEQHRAGESIEIGATLAVGTLPKY
ncbi:MAG: acetyltransferase, partial [Planctomycetaceae bacterium]|nr:acetyltransferase [Planctomycetaceae bacterium]